MFDIQPDEDQADPDERHDPDSDMEMDDHKAVEESTRSLPHSLPVYDVFFFHFGLFFNPDSDLVCPSSFHFFVIGGATF